MKHDSRVENALFERFDRLFRTIITVPKSALTKEEAKQKRRKKRAKKTQ